MSRATNHTPADKALLPRIGFAGAASAAVAGLLIMLAQIPATSARVGGGDIDISPGGSIADVSTAALGEDSFETEDNEVIVAVYLRRTRISEGIIAYTEGDDLLMPLEELMMLLEFSVKETKNGATGWFISQDRTFSIDLTRQEANVEGKRHKLGPNDTKRIDDELFVSAKRLSQWLPIDFRANFRALTLTVGPREPLPVDKRLDRKKQKFGGTYQYRSTLPRHYSDYRLAQIPATQIDLTLGHSSRSGDLFYSGGTVRAYGDLLMMNGDLFITGSHKKVRNARIRLGRKDPDGGLLGPLNATKYEIGDVSGASVPLVSSNISGRGAHITSRTSSAIAEFDRITLEGNLEADFEVELYRNNILINAQRRGEGQAGRYVFTDVQLFRGANDIRLEFYGPQGQRRTETKSYNAGGGRVSVGNFNYDISIHEAGRSVFGFDDSWRDYAARRFGGNARIDYGLTRDVSMTAGFVAAPIPVRKDGLGNAIATTQDDDDYRYYGTLGFRTHLWGAALSFDSAVDDTGGVALGAGAQTTLGGWSLSLRQHNYLNGYRSGSSIRQVYNVDQGFNVSDTTASIRKAFQPFGGVTLGLGVSANYSIDDDGSTDWSLRGDMNLSAGFISLGNNTRYNHGSGNGSTTAGANETFVDGSSHVNINLFQAVSLRGSVNYQLGGINQGIRSISAGLGTQLPWDVGFNVGYSRNMAFGQTRFGNENYYASLKRDFGWANFGVTGAYNRSEDPEIDTGYTVGISMSFSTFTDPDTFETDFSSKPIAQKGAVRVATYFDENRNGIRDEGERLISRAKVLIAGARGPQYTGDEDYVSRATRTNGGGWKDVIIAKGGLPSGDLSSGSKGRSVLPRPGTVVEIELPVINTADIEGSVYLSLGEKERSVPNLVVQIVSEGADGQAKVVAQAATEFDGLFVMSAVPVGTYLLRIEPEQALRLGIKDAVVSTITLKPGAGVVSGVKIYLDRDRAKATLQLDQNKG